MFYSVHRDSYGDIKCLSEHSAILVPSNNYGKINQESVPSQFRTCSATALFTLVEFSNWTHFDKVWLLKVSLPFLLDTRAPLKSLYIREYIGSKIISILCHTLFKPLCSSSNTYHDKRPTLHHEQKQKVAEFRICHVNDIYVCSHAVLYMYFCFVMLRCKNDYKLLQLWQPVFASKKPVTEHRHAN